MRKRSRRRTDLPGALIRARKHRGSTVEEGNVDLLPGSEKKTSMLSSNTCSIGRVNGTRRSSVTRRSYWWPWTGEG
jgi:hypothetical protein